MCSNEIYPILKWAGGKRQLLQIIKQHMPHNFDRYHEPFVGAGALFLSLQPAEAIINDSNWELINVYEVVRDSPNELLVILQHHQNLHSKEHFYSVRELDRDPARFKKKPKIELAARTIYLNKTCYNGLYRVNSKGFFNTPMGRYKKPNIVNENGVIKLSDFLNSANIRISVGDYAKALEKVSKNDFVYLDPPYQPVSSTSAFTSYTKEGFSSKQQDRLRSVCDELTKAGVKFLQSNSDSLEIRKIYRKYMIKSIPARRYINSKADGRIGVGELLIYNY